MNANVQQALSKKFESHRIVFWNEADSNIHRIKNSAETSVTVNVVFNYKNNERTQLQSPLQRAS